MLYPDLACGSLLPFRCFSLSPSTRFSVRLLYALGFLNGEKRRRKNTKERIEYKERKMGWRQRILNVCCMYLDFSMGEKRRRRWTKERKDNKEERNWDEEEGGKESLEIRRMATKNFHCHPLFIWREEENESRWNSPADTTVFRFSLSHFAHSLFFLPFSLGLFSDSFTSPLSFQLTSCFILISFSLLHHVCILRQCTLYYSVYSSVSSLSLSFHCITCFLFIVKSCFPGGTKRLDYEQEEVTRNFTCFIQWHWCWFIHVIVIRDCVSSSSFSAVPDSLFFDFSSWGIKSLKVE